MNPRIISQYPCVKHEIELCRYLVNSTILRLKTNKRLVYGKKNGKFLFYNTCF